MFLNPIWSLLLLAAVFAFYFLVTRPMLKAKYPELYENVDGWLISHLKWLAAFKKTLVAIIGAIITAAPDLLVQIAPVDFSHWLPPHLAALTGPVCFCIIALMKAFEPKASS